MGLRIYRLTSTSTSGGAGAVGIALTTIVARGTIVGVAFSSIMEGGAGVGRYMIECAINNNALSNAETASGAPSEQMLARYALCVGNALAGQANGFIPMNRKVDQGNTICINQNQGGTPASVHRGGFDVLVME